MALGSCAPAQKYLTDAPRSISFCQISRSSVIYVILLCFGLSSWLERCISAPAAHPLS